MLSRKKNLNPQGEVMLRNVAIQRVTKDIYRSCRKPTNSLERPHINCIKKNSKSRGIIWIIRNTLDFKSKKIVYYSLIHPYLNYCFNLFLKVQSDDDESTEWWWSHTISHSKYWWLCNEQSVENAWFNIMVFSGHHYFYKDLKPNISMIESHSTGMCHWLPCKQVLFLLINRFV